LDRSHSVSSRDTSGESGTVAARRESESPRRGQGPLDPAHSNSPGDAPRGTPCEAPGNGRGDALRMVRTINAILQGATVELFHFYGVAMGPALVGDLRGEAKVHRDPVSTVEFAAPGFSGMLALSANPEVFLAMTELPCGPEVSGDWAREVTNQLMGKVKSRIARFQIALHVELPLTRLSSDVDRQIRASKQQLLYSFRTLKGDVIVTLAGDFDQGTLAFSNASPLPLDDKPILF
jgi:hypothetical protein